MKLADFDYDLPPELIAQTAATPRDSARLLVWPQQELKVFRDLPSLLNPGDVLVLNTSKVIPARLYGVRKAREYGKDVEVEILLHQPQGPGLQAWSTMARPGRRLKEGDEIALEGNASVTIEAKRPDGQVVIRFKLPASEVETYLETHGHTPLPPYIRADDTAAVRARYQTVYADAQNPGSVAAPTAGLHFTSELLEKLKAKGIHIAYVTLHVGAGTFLNPTEEQVKTKTLHSEWANLSPETAQAVLSARAAGKNVIPVGTTALRTLESWALAGESSNGFSGSTTLFIQPGFKFKAATRLVTNFHLPQSSLLMLVVAFVGPTWKELYQQAISNRLRFFSFGDSSLLTRYDTHL